MSTCGDPARLAKRISFNIQISQRSVEMQRLQQKQQYANQLAKETDKHINEFGSLPTTSSEQRQRKIQKDHLVAEVTTSLTNFQKREKEFVAPVRGSSRVSGGFPEESSKERNLVSWESQTQPQEQVQDEEITEDDLRLIHETDIVDINKIFKDLGMMIHEQGDVVDSIEANVENAEEVHVQQANQQLSRAADYQCKSRKPLCIIIFVLVIGVVVIVLIIGGVHG
uniref:Syntaxin-7 n=1 Tax=Microcebus murinus TaxID=30608 RepID=A0A8C5VWE3_MICMU